MPKRKAHVTQHTNNLQTNRGTQSVKRLDTDTGSSSPALSSRQSLSSGSELIPLTSAIRLENYDQLISKHTHTELFNVSPSPANITRHQHSVALETQAEDKIVLENPPYNMKDCNPSDNQHFHSLAEDKEDKALDLPSLDAEDLDNKDATKETKASNQKPISHNEAVKIVGRLRNIINNLLHGHR
ncbi:DDE family endonuclease [Rhizoctonia solani]|uniref:DDE family endonuclease n=1 Tax=Rhizoctonia solani TaxID=456999 RepID=A0A8H8P210_9AGAM|nr:DDE family endonuclease [Rhizoctonia solani]QRW22521.1 DDE family endonuclease [Rhizoctonia solani]